MGNNNHSETNFNASNVKLFRFELSKPQTVIILILSFTGILMLPFRLAEIIFVYFFPFLFYFLPRFFSELRGDYFNFLVYNLSVNIIGILVHIVFFVLSLFAFRKLLKGNTNQKVKKKKKVITSEDISNWFGLKISQGQSLTLFILSLTGTILLVGYFLFLSLDPLPSWELLDYLCYIPYGPNEGITDYFLLDTIPIAIILIFLLICIYTLFIVRRGKAKESSKQPVQNRSLLLFIISLTVLILSGARIFCHLALFNPIISHALPISYHYPNSYQMIDFIITISVTLLALVLMITSFFLKRKTQLEKEPSIQDLSWLRINLTPKRALILISLAFVFLIFILGSYLLYLFQMHLYFLFRTPISILLNFAPVIFLLLCYSPIGKLLKENRFKKIVNELEKSGDYKISWFNFRLENLESLTIFSTSLGLIMLFVYQLVSWNIRAQKWLMELFPSQLFLILSLPLITGVISIVLVFLVYTLKKNYHSVKSVK